MKKKCHRWEPISGIVGPAADISFSYAGRDLGTVTLHFSRVKGLPSEDLSLHFTHLVALRWELECPGFDPTPENLPKCISPKWSGWTFPLLEIENSSWLDQYAPTYIHPNGPSLSHFLLVSMNDLVQIIACSDVKSEWVAPLEDTTKNAEPAHSANPRNAGG